MTTLLTQVEVDDQDPAFSSPTIPGSLHDKYEEEAIEPNAQIGKPPKRVIPHPTPKNIVELKTIRALVDLGNIVVCCGGGGIPVVRRNGQLQGIPAVINKDQTSALLARTLGADAFVMLSDIDGLYKNFGTADQELVETIFTDKIDKEFLDSLPSASIAPKVFSGIEFVEKTGGWAAIGSLEKLKEIMSGNSGTRIIRPDRRKHQDLMLELPDNMSEWNRDHIKQWLSRDLRVQRDLVEKIINLGYDAGHKLLSIRAQQLEDIGVSWSMATHIVQEVAFTNRVPYNNLPCVAASPYRWPFNKRFSPENTALLIIGMQRDAVEEGGYLSTMGYSLDASQRAVGPIRQILDMMRKLGFHIIYTREGHRSNLSDCPPNKHWRSLNLSNFGIGTQGPLGRLLVRGDHGWDIIDKLKPLENEVIIDKPGKGAFYATDLECILRTTNVQNLILVGVATDVCVHTTLREANDRGFECLVISDATAAAEAGVHWAAIRSIEQSGGVFGATCDSNSLLATLQKLEKQVTTSE